MILGVNLSMVEEGARVHMGIPPFFFKNFLHILVGNEEVFLFSILVLYTSLNLQLISVGVLVSVLIVLIPQYCYGRDDC